MIKKKFNCLSKIPLDRVELSVQDCILKTKRIGRLLMGEGIFVVYNIS